jgi:HK97 family phage prohead protease
MNRKKLDAKFAPTAKGFAATITTATLDRDGEVVIPQGMNATEYLKNPVLLWNHDSNLPVGRCVQLQRTDAGIVGEFEFAQRPDGFQGPYFPEFAASLVAQGIVKGVSIGYATEQGGVRRATAEDRKRHGDAVHTVFNKWKLWEVSLAPVQSNPDALVSAIRKGAVCASDAARWLGWVPGTVRHRVEITIPTAKGASGHRIAPIDYSSIVRRELARARGAIR